MKICSKCGYAKPLEEYSKNKAKKDGLQTCCISCNKSRMQEYYKVNNVKEKKRIKVRRNALTEKIQEYKTDKKCAICKEDDICCLDFHHLNDDKDMGISQMVHWGYSWNRILTEINKCVILCANCHRKVHAGKLMVSRV